MISSSCNLLDVSWKGERILKPSICTKSSPTHGVQLVQPDPVLPANVPESVFVLSPALEEVNGAIESGLDHRPPAFVEHHFTESEEWCLQQIIGGDFVDSRFPGLYLLTGWRH
jgi:hypothetical protein